MLRTTAFEVTEATHAKVGAYAFIHTHIVYVWMGIGVIRKLQIVFEFFLYYQNVSKFFSYIS